VRIKAAFKKATCQFLVETAGLDDGAIAIVGKPGKPRPNCGPWFYGVWGGGRAWQMKTALDALVNVNITITKRLEQPLDRLDDALDAECDGIDEAVGRLITLLWNGQNLIRSMTAALMDDGVPTILDGVGGSSDGTSEAPRVLNDSEPDYCGPDWFSSPPVGGPEALQVYGLQATVVFGGLRITHPWDSAVL
jgi:hypothetical protein